MIPGSKGNAYMKSMSLEPVASYFMRKGEEEKK